MESRGARSPVVAIIGPGDHAGRDEVTLAETVGALAAESGWVIVSGGRDAGVMAAAARGARQSGGVVIGLLPTADASGAAPDCDIVIPTGLGEARNVLVVLASAVVVACGMSAGTASEAAFALAARRPLVLVQPDSVTAEFFTAIGGSLVHLAGSAEEAIAAVRARVGGAA